MTKKERQCESSWLHSRESIPEVDKERGCVIASQILLGPVLMWYLSEIDEHCVVFRDLLGLLSS